MCGTSISNTEFVDVNEYKDKLKVDAKSFDNDPNSVKMNFVRVYHDFKWQLGGIMKGLKTKRTYDVILLGLETENEDDELWKLNNIDKNVYSLAFELGQEIISKARKYFAKETNEEWFVTCKVNTVTQAKKIGPTSMTINGKTIPVKMQFIDFT